MRGWVTSALATGLALGLMLAGGQPVSGQSDAPDFRILHSDGATAPLTTFSDRGFTVVPIAVFESMGWFVGEVETAVALSGPHGVVVTMRLGSPFVYWNDEVVQIADAPYREGAEVRVPLQLLIDLVPSRLPELYAFDGPSLILRAADPATWGGTAVGVQPEQPQLPETDGPPVAVPPPEASRPLGNPSSSDAQSASAPYEGPRVVVIDAGHGGGDPGTLGGGLREKNVALGVALAMAELLRREPGLEVYLTRDDDTFVPIWDRGDRATEWKGERPGVFISVHANSFPSIRSARGFETYFLSEARTDHEKRVAAIENAPLQVQGQDIDPDEQPDLGFILRELRNLDHQHWSALLAEFVQEEMGKFHPGPNRGVKQGVLAVLTNALMPSVLVEVGFLSNSDESPLLGQKSFQDEAARSIARAVVRFFERYPPGSGTGGVGADR
jgi:N-acetylmuramoyl-L-alanine amidase